MGVISGAAPCSISVDSVEIISPHTTIKVQTGYRPIAGLTTTFSVGGSRTLNAISCSERNQRLSPRRGGETLSSSGPEQKNH